MQGIFMGIYDNPFESVMKSISFKPEKWGKIIAGILAIIILVGVAIWIQAFFQPQVISASFQPNPFSIGKDTGAILNLNITNLLPESAENVQISIQSSSNSFFITPKNQTIDVLGSKETRKLEMVVNPLNLSSKRFYPGTYSFEIQVILNQQYFYKTIQLEVKE